METANVTSFIITLRTNRKDEIMAAALELGINLDTSRIQRFCAACHSEDSLIRLVGRDTPLVEYIPDF